MMNKKKALPDDIGNFFQGESVFFQPPKDVTEISSPEAAADKTPSETSPPQQKERILSYPLSPAEPQTNPVFRDAVKPHPHDTVVSRNHESTPSSTQESNQDTTVERIRKSVKQFGKEAATHRFTLEEKRLLADIVYTYERRGYRTSENEITRIAINWLILDYQEYGEQSILSRLLEALHE